MEINRDELRQVTQFKDAVLSAADARRIDIISKAQADSAKIIAAAQAACQLADHAAVSQRMELDIERQTSAATQAARQELLAAREKLVADMFAEVEQQLLEFTQKGTYGDWLVKKLTAHPFPTGSAVVIYLRGEDMPHAAKLQNALPGSRVQADPAIRLGGLKAADGKVMYDDTMDLALAAEKEDFYLKSGLTL